MSFDPYVLNISDPGAMAAFTTISQVFFRDLPHLHPVPMQLHPHGLPDHVGTLESEPAGRTDVVITLHPER